MVKWVIGIDEAGRGPLAGPVAVGAVAMAYARGRRFFKKRRVRDGKHLSARQREGLLAQVQEWRRQGLLDFATALVGEKIIDRRGIVKAVRLGIRRSLFRLNRRPSQCLVLLDGSLRAPRQYLNQKTIIRGDETNPLIALASVAAKVRRDRKMVRFAARHPAYGFERHKGYGTKAHYRAIREHGLSPLHRRSFLKGF